MRHLRRRAYACGSRLTPCREGASLRMRFVALRQVRVECVAGARPRLVSAVARSQDRSLVAFVSLRFTAMLARSQRVRPWAMGEPVGPFTRPNGRRTLRVRLPADSFTKSAHSRSVHSPFGSFLRMLVRKSVRPRGGGRTDLRSLPRLRLVKTLAPQLARTTIHRIIVSRSSAPSHEPRCARFCPITALRSHGNPCSLYLFVLVPPRLLPSTARMDVALSLRSGRCADSLRSDGTTAPYPFWTALAP